MVTSYWKQLLTALITFIDFICLQSFVRKNEAFSGSQTVGNRQQLLMIWAQLYRCFRLESIASRYLLIKARSTIKLFNRLLLHGNSRQRGDFDFMLFYWFVFIYQKIEASNKFSRSQTVAADNSLATWVRLCFTVLSVALLYTEMKCDFFRSHDRQLATGNMGLLLLFLFP